LFVNNTLVSWSSKRHRTRALSSMEAEYMEATEAGKEVLWAREMMRFLRHPQHKPTVIYEDNKSCINYTKNASCHARSKHIDIRAYWLRDMYNDDAVRLIHCGTHMQLADMMTKYKLVGEFLAHVNAIREGRRYEYVG
jgi:hypothetical protein